MNDAIHAGHSKTVDTREAWHNPTSCRNPKRAPCSGVQWSKPGWGVVGWVGFEQKQALHHCSVAFACTGVQRGRANHVTRLHDLVTRREMNKGKG
jgi:hypothetical protein